MTSEDPQHTGQEPDGAAPDAARSAPYGPQPGSGGKRYPIQEFNAATGPEGAGSPTGPSAFGTGWGAPPPSQPPPSIGPVTPPAPSGSAPVPQPADRIESAAWPGPEAAGRATGFVPTNAREPGPGPARWAAPQHGPLHGAATPAEINARVAAVTSEPWSSAEAWGPAKSRQPSFSPPAGEPPAAQYTSDHPETPPDSPAPPPGRPLAESGGDQGWSPAEPPPAQPPTAEPPPAQPSPVPGFSPRGVVPLPPQQTRVPGASLAALPPNDYTAGQPPTNFWSLAAHSAAEARRAENRPPESGPGQREPASGRPELPDPVPSDQDGAGSAFAGPAPTGYVGRASRRNAFQGGIAAAFPVRNQGGPEAANAGEAPVSPPPAYVPPPETNSAPSYDRDADGAPPPAAVGSPVVSQVPRQRPASEPGTADHVAMTGPEQPAPAPAPGGSAPAVNEHSGAPAGSTPPAVGRAVSASAAVPLASRMMPPTDDAARAAPQPRVYGRPAAAEPVDSGEPDEPAEHAEQQPWDAPVPPSWGRMGEMNPPNVAAVPPARVAPAVPDQLTSDPGTAPFGDWVDPAGERPGSGPPDQPFGPRPTNPFGARPANPFGARPEPPQAYQPGVPLGTREEIPDPVLSEPAVPAGPGGWDAPAQPQRGRFDSFKPDAPEPPKAEPPTPQVRNGRVLLGVLTAAVLILVVPLGGLWLLGKMRSSDAPFIPDVGQCVRNEGDRPVPADCSAEGAFQVVSKVEQLTECPAPQQEHVVIPASDNNPRQVLCLQPAPTTTG